MDIRSGRNRSEKNGRWKFSKFSINDRISREIDKYIGKFSDYDLIKQISDELVKRLKIVVE